MGTKNRTREDGGSVKGSLGNLGNLGIRTPKKQPYVLQ